METSESFSPDPNRNSRQSPHAHAVVLWRLESGAIVGLLQEGGEQHQQLAFILGERRDPGALDDARKSLQPSVQQQGALQGTQRVHDAPVRALRSRDEGHTRLDGDAQGVDALQDRAFDVCRPREDRILAFCEREGYAAGVSAV